MRRIPSLLQAPRPVLIGKFRLHQTPAFVLCSSFVLFERDDDEDCGRRPFVSGPGFTPDLEIWGFPDFDRLTKCGPRTLKENKQVGMELVDAQGRRWLVQSVNRTGRTGSLFSRIPILGLPQSRIEQELEPMTPLSLDEVIGARYITKGPSF